MSIIVFKSTNKLCLQLKGAKEICDYVVIQETVVLELLSNRQGRV